MEEKVLSEKESLALISNMINKAKGHYYESGSSALLWGFSNVICFTLAYLLENGFYLPFNPFSLMGITVVLQVYFHLRERRVNKTVTYKDEVNSYVWLSFGISISILTIAGGFADIGYIVLPLLLLLFGMPTFISGCIKKFPICFFYKANEVFLLVALGAFCAWVIPGFILRKKFYQNLAMRNNGI